jgi:predicted Zn-dependent peptidase
MNIKTKTMKSFFRFILLAALIFFNLTPSIKAQEKFRKSPPLPYPLPDLSMPSMKASALSNGLQISVVQKQQPFIDLHLIIMTGESLSPDHLPGMASLTANMLFKGAVGISASQVEEQIEYIGGDFSVKTYPDYTVFSISFLKGYLNEAVMLLSHLLTQPDFSKNEVNNVKRDMFYEIIRNTNPELLGRKLLFQIIFNNHPYEKYVFNSSVIKRLTRKDLLTFFDKFYRPNNSELLIIGDISHSRVIDISEKHLGLWPKKSLETYHINPPPEQMKPKICFSDVSDSEEATVFIGNILPYGDKEDYFSYLVFNQILGGSHISRLFMNLRETKGYAYWAFSNIELFKNCELFYVRAKVKPEHLYSSIQEILKETRNLIENKIPNHEIEQAKSYLIGHFPIKISDHKEFSFRIAEMIALDMKEIYWGDYYENIMYTNSNSVFNTFQKVNFLNPVVVVVGDKDIVLDHIKEFEEVEIFNNEGVFQYKLKKGTQNNSIL